MAKMISLIPHRFGGRGLSEGEPFECEERYVEVLRTLGRAKRAEPDAQTKVAETQSGEQYNTREIPSAQRKKSTRRKRGSVQ